MKRCCNAIFVLIILYINQCHGEMQLDSNGELTIKSINVEETSDFELSCNLDSKTNASLIWKKDDVIIQARYRQDAVSGSPTTNAKKYQLVSHCAFFVNNLCDVYESKEKACNMTFPIFSASMQNMIELCQLNISISAVTLVLCNQNSVSDAPSYFSKASKNFNFLIYIFVKHPPYSTSKVNKKFHSE